MPRLFDNILDFTTFESSGGVRSPFFLTVLDNGDGTATLTWTDSVTRTEGYYVPVYTGNTGTIIVYTDPKTHIATINNPNTPYAFSIEYYLGDDTLVATSNTVTKTITGDTAGAAKITQLVTAGYFFGTGESAALMQWFADNRSNNLLSKRKFVTGLFFGNAAHNMIPLIGNTPNQGNVITNAKSETGTGTPGAYINTTVAPSTVFSSLTGGCIQAYYKSQPPDAAHYFGCGTIGTGSSVRGSVNYGGDVFFDFGDWRTLAYGDGGTKGYYSFLRTGAISGRITRYTGSQSVLSTTTIDLDSGQYAIPADEFFFMAYNDAGNPIFLHSDELGLIGIADTDSTTETDLMEVLDYTLLTAFGAI